MATAGYPPALYDFIAEMIDPGLRTTIAAIDANFIPPKRSFTAWRRRSFSTNVGSRFLFVAVML